VATGQLLEISNGSSISTGSGSFDPVAGFNILKSLKNRLFRTSGFLNTLPRDIMEPTLATFWHQLNYTLFFI